MLKAAALNQKAWKKRPLIKLLHLLGVMRSVIFHATSEEEITEIQAAFGDVSIRKISNVPCVPVETLAVRQKQPGTAALTFVGRVHPTKNLLWLILAMRTVTADCRLTIIGPIQDATYHHQCLDSIKQLPSNVAIDFVGVKSEQEVRALVADSDVMILPTLGENFGHAIFEAFASGTPVIISDRTIWRNLTAQQAGWDLSLDHPEAFATAIGDIAAMDQTEHQIWRQAALDIAHGFLQQNELIQEYQSLFFADQNVETE
jgi:glycosyltransferase involved in cell wall biosynthesis